MAAQSSAVTNGALRPRSKDDRSGPNGARKIYRVNHHLPHSAFGAARNHFIDPPNKKKFRPHLNFPDRIKCCMRFMNSTIGAVVYSAAVLPT